MKKSDFGKQRVYNENPEFKALGFDQVIKLEVVQLEEKRQFQVVFESQQSPRRQGLWLRTDGTITVNGQEGPSIYLWYPWTIFGIKIARSVINCKCTSKDGLLAFYNIWEVRGFLKRGSLGPQSGMLVDEISPNERRYRCQDFGSNPDFTSLIFRIKLLD